MKQRYRSIIDVHVLMRRPDGQILLMERANTGYADHQLCPPSGHLEEGESVVDGAIREVNEEVGVTIDPSDLTFVHVTTAFRTTVGLPGRPRATCFNCSTIFGCATTSRCNRVCSGGAAG